MSGPPSATKFNKTGKTQTHAGFVKTNVQLIDARVILARTKEIEALKEFEAEKYGLLWDAILDEIREECPDVYAEIKHFAPADWPLKQERS